MIQDRSGGSESVVQTIWLRLEFSISARRSGPKRRLLALIELVERKRVEMRPGRDCGQRWLVLANGPGHAVSRC